MKKYDCLLVLLGLSIVCTSANAVEHYTATKDTVVDNFTGLEWQRKEAGPLNQALAKKHCKELALNGKNDWKLSTVEELSTLPDRHRQKPAVDVDAFPDTPAEAFWTSSALVGRPNSAWDVSFDSGFVSGSVIDTKYRVRCVR